MRVFELARELGIKSAAVLAAVEQAGVDASRVDHASDKLRPEDEAALRTFLVPAAPAVAEPEAGESEVPPEPAPAQAGGEPSAVTVEPAALPATEPAGFADLTGVPPAEHYALVGCAGVGWHGGRVERGGMVTAAELAALPEAWREWFVPVVAGEAA